MAERGTGAGHALEPGQLDALILCGGAGTRLRRALADRPKTLAPIGEQPFLEILLGRLQQRGVRRFVLCTGYLGDALEAALPRLARFGAVELSREESPLGTGGALRLALPRVRSNPFLVANGDSVCDADLAAMLRFHRARPSRLTLAVARVDTSADFGTLELAADGRVVSFHEKQPDAPAGFASAGLYLIERSFFESFAPRGSFSLERELFPLALEHGAFGFELAGSFLDIGTVERYRAAPRELSRLGLLAEPEED